MEAVRLIAKENITDIYGLRPVSAYDIEGVLVQKEGKNVKIEKNIDDGKVCFSIRLKEEIKAEIGQKVKINGEDILSYRIQKPSRETNIVVDNIIESLGLESSNDIKETIIHLMENEIPVTKENIEIYLTSKEYLKEVVKRLDLNTIINLLDMGMDIMEEPLHKIIETLPKVKGDKVSIKGFLKPDKTLTYKEAENIAVKIYGRKMGKDVYEAIIALNKEQVPINKENVERVLEVVNKLYDLKDSNDQVFVKALNEDITLSIENLYKIKHSYRSDRLNKNIVSPIYEGFTVEKEPGYEDIVRILDELNIETKAENISLAREFLLNEVQITDTGFQRAVHMKNALKQLTDSLNKENIARLISEGIDPLKEDIFELIEYVKAHEDKPIDMSSMNVGDILKNIEKYREITDKELIFLIKNHEDFKLENLNRIIDTKIELSDGMTKKALEKAISITKIINTLGDLDENVISLASRRYSNITLNNLYKSSLELAEKTEVEINPEHETKVEINQADKTKVEINPTDKSKVEINQADKAKAETNPADKAKAEINPADKAKVEINQLDKARMEINQTDELKVETDPLDETMDSLVRREYYNIRKSITISLIKCSIKDGISMEDMPLKELNEYIDRKSNKHKETEKIYNDIRNIKGREESSVLAVMKNNSDMCLKEICNANIALGPGTYSDSDNKNGDNKKPNTSKIPKKISKDDLAVQIPVDFGDEISNLNLIIPDMKKGFDAGDMTLYLSIETKKLGYMEFNLHVKENIIYFKSETSCDKIILDNIALLEEKFNTIGYRLEILE